MDQDIVPASTVRDAFGVGHVPADHVPILGRNAERIPVAFRTGSGSTLRSTHAFPGNERDVLDDGLIDAGFLGAVMHPLSARITARNDRASQTAAFDLTGSHPATRVSAETDPAFAEVEIPADPNEAATLRHNAARLLAEARIAGQLAATTPPRAWPRDFARRRLTVAAHAQVKHEIDADFDQLGENHGVRDGSR